MSYFSDEVARQQSSVLQFDRFWISLTGAFKKLIDECKPELRAGTVDAQSTSDRKCTVVYLGRKLYVAGDACQQKLEFWITSNLTFDNLENASLISVEDRGVYSLSEDSRQFPFVKSTLKVASPDNPSWLVHEQLAVQLLSRLIIPRWKDARFKEHNE